MLGQGGAGLGGGWGFLDNLKDPRGQNKQGVRNSSLGPVLFVLTLRPFEASWQLPCPGPLLHVAWPLQEGFGDSGQFRGPQASERHSRLSVSGSRGP